VRSKFVAAGIPATAIRPDKDPDYNINILILSPADPMLAKADRAAIARLQIDAKTAFDFPTETQRVAFAPFVSKPPVWRSQNRFLTAGLDGLF
jgi:hypothetical protein